MRMRSTSTARLSFLAVPVVLSLALILASASSNVGAGTVSTPESATPAATPESAPFITTDGSWEILVTEIVSRNTLLGYVAEGIYVVVFFEVSNTSTLNDVFPYSAFRITDSAGNEYAPDSTTTSRMVRDVSGNSDSEVINRGTTVETAVVFDIAVDSDGLELSGPAWPEPIAFER